MKTSIYFKITIACLGLLTSLGAAFAQTVEAKPSAVQALEKSAKNYKMMGILELATRAGKGDQKAADILERRLRKKPASSKYNVPAGYVIGTGKGLGTAAKSPETQDDYFRRRTREIPRELEKHQARLLEIKALMLAGKGTAETKKEISQILKKVKKLNEEVEFIKAMKTVSAYGGAAKQP